MKRFLKAVSVIAGLGALVWMMRDRFVSLAIPREQTPPSFRVAPVPAGPARSGDDLTAIVGIGPVYADRLRSAGFGSFASIASARAADLAAAAGIAESRVGDWISQAKGMGAA